MGLAGGVKFLQRHLTPSKTRRLLLTGRGGGSWRFSESDPTTWERIPASTDPVVLMRQ